MLRRTVPRANNRFKLMGTVAGFGILFTGLYYAMTYVYSQPSSRSQLEAESITLCHKSFSNVTCWRSLICIHVHRRYSYSAALEGDAERKEAAFKGEGDALIRKHQDALRQKLEKK
jgi:hypothetical protein